MCVCVCVSDKCVSDSVCGCMVDHNSTTTTTVALALRPLFPAHFPLLSAPSLCPLSPPPLHLSVNGPF